MAHLILVEFVLTGLIKAFRLAAGCIKVGGYIFTALSQVF
jgi:hypothetical protein